MNIIKMAFVLLRFLALAVCLVGAESLRCGAIASTTLAVSWEPVNATDLYYVEISSSDTEEPFALQTTAFPAATLIDLVPGTSYYLSMRSHPAQSNIVWGWRAATPRIKCVTMPARMEAPNSLKRVGDSPSAHSLVLGWVAADVQRADRHRAMSMRPAHVVGVRKLGTSTWRWEPVAMTASQHEVGGLEGGQVWEVIVRDELTGELSDALQMRTSTPGAQHVTAYRVSEYTFDVDFLENHDAANQAAMPVYFQNGGALNESASSGAAATNWTFDECLSQMAASCAPHRGSSFECMRCADEQRPAITGKCGKFSDGDDHLGWAVHFYCGIGWPGSSFQRSPITEYCVEHQAAPQTDPTPGGDGYAQYISCNSDECDGALLPTGNLPREPTCICWVWDDRLISHEPKNRTLAVCDPHDKIPWTRANQCNCSQGASGTEATMLPPDAPMANYVGRSKVYLPYYRYRLPMDTYPVSVLVGDNLSFPKKGACVEGGALGDDGCTWRRLPTSRMVYGPDLLAAGWNVTPVRGVGSIEEELKVTFANIEVFKAALAKMDSMVTPRCCGC